ncbi:hypothetical protein ACLBOM_21340 [Escherichia coli]
MRCNLSHIAAMAFNEPLLLEPAYARVFFCALGKEIVAALPFRSRLFSLMPMVCSWRLPII